MRSESGSTPTRWRLAGIQLKKLALGIHVLPVAIDHLPLRVSSECVQRAFQAARLVQIVGIQPADPCAVGLAKSLVQGICGACVSAAEPLHARILALPALQGIQYLRCAATVGNDQLLQLGLCQGTADRRIQVGAWVSAGHQHADHQSLDGDVSLVS